MIAGRKSAQSRDRGVALITAMLITALASIVAANLAWDNALDVRRTMVNLNRDQAVQVALGAESLIMGMLRQDLEDSETDHLAEFWAGELPGFPIEGGEVFGNIEDLQGRFNVNNLIDRNGKVDTAAMEQFERLLGAIGIDPRFAGVAADWLDSDADAGFPNGAEDPIYTGMLPPYRSPNQFLTSISELAALEGMDKLTFDLLKSHVTALPGRTSINVNTATPLVLQSLGENISASDVEGLLMERESAGFNDVEAAFSAFVTPEAINGLGESSEYFQLKVVVRIDTVLISVYSVLQRGPRGDVTPIVRSFGTT